MSGFKVRLPETSAEKTSTASGPQQRDFFWDQTSPEGSKGGNLTLHVVSEMEDRLDAGCPRQEGMFLMLFERPVVLRHVHRQAKISLVSGRQRSRDRMPERPAQPQRSLVGESRRLIPALWLGMALLLVGRPDRLRHRLRSQDVHAF